MRSSLSAELVRRARDRGDCSTEQLAVLSGRGPRAVRHALSAEESAAEQLLRLHCRSASPAELAAVVRDVAALLGAPVVVFERGAAAPLLRLVDAAGEAAEAVAPLRRAA